MNNDRLLTLTDETGTVQDFLFLDLILYHDDKYIVLIHPNEKEVIILKISGDTESGEEIYISVDDDKILEEVYAAFKERNEDIYIFIVTVKPHPAFTALIPNAKITLSI